MRDAGGMPDDRTLGDLAGANAYLRSLPYHNGKVGVIGFCSGGRQTYLVACRLSGFDAAVGLLGWRRYGHGRRAYPTPAGGAHRFHRRHELPNSGPIRQ